MLMMKLFEKFNVGHAATARHFLITGVLLLSGLMVSGQVLAQGQGQNQSHGQNQGQGQGQGQTIEAVKHSNPFPDLVNSDGAPVSMTDHIAKGDWTLVMLWTTDCFICKQQKPLISAFHNKHKGNGIQVVGIALDGHGQLGAVRNYLSHLTPSFPNYVGNMDLVALNYQLMTQEPLRGTPTYLLFDPQGVLKGNNPGPVRPVAVENFIARLSQAQ